MGIVTEILKRIEGRIKISVYIDKKPFIDIDIKKTNITIDIKDPFMVIELGLKDIQESKDTKKEIMRMVKKRGYSLSIKYGGFQFEI